MIPSLFPFFKSSFIIAKLGLIQMELLIKELTCTKTNSWNWRLQASFDFFKFIFKNG